VICAEATSVFEPNVESRCLATYVAYSSVTSLTIRSGIGLRKSGSSVSVIIESKYSAFETSDVQLITPENPGTSMRIISPMQVNGTLIPSSICSKSPPGLNPLVIIIMAPRLIMRVRIAQGRVITRRRQMIAQAAVPHTKRSGSHVSNLFGLKYSDENGIGIACAINDIKRNTSTFIENPLKF
jgi:hypothetical protein